MPAPDLNDPTKVEAKTVTMSVGTATGTNATLILTCPSSAVCRIISLTAGNVDGANAADITLQRFATNTATTGTAVFSTIAVPADAALTLVGGENKMNVTENQAIRAVASADGDLVIDCSYEEIT